MRNIYLGTRRPREHEVNALFSASLLRAFHLHNFCFRRWRVWPLGRGRRLRCQLSILNLLKLYLFISLPCGKRNVYSSFRHDLGFSLFFLSFFPSFLLPSHVTLGVYSCFFWDNGRRLSANPLMGSSARSWGRGGNEGGRGSESPLRISGLITLGSFAIKVVINYVTNDVMFTHYYGGPVRFRKMMIMVRMISIRLIIIMMMLMRMM